MNSNIPFAALPDLSARIMRHALTKELNVNWENFCTYNHLKPFSLDGGATELLAQDELLLQQGFVETTANHPNLWFDVGLRYRSIKYGTLGLAMMTARTLIEALDVACRYQALTYSLINYRSVHTANGACALIGDDSDLPAHLRNFTQHRDLGAIRTLISDLMAGQTVLERVTVSAPPPVNWAALEKAFPCPVEFDADRTQWIFLPGTANRPLPLADGELSSLYSTRCDGLLGKARADAPVTQRLAILLGSGSEHFLSAGEAARRLALSERTLHRRLAEEGTRFSTLVDEARYRQARALLADRRMAIETIAFAVGFAEPSSFSRAFKRWSGMGALEYRRQQID
ncbi:MAG: AraC family transcriptional regulator [Rhodocyclaceae bacterium]|nr:MAG: AraC family transcriptional regulator [Rhodocyclaceae bacterium]